MDGQSLDAARALLWWATMTFRSAPLALTLAVALVARGQDTPQPPPLRGYADWQAHPAMHVAFPFFRGTLDDSLPRRTLTWRHMLRQTLYPAHLEASGVRLMGAAAYVPERTRDREAVRRSVLEQLAWVEALVARHPADLALARTPEEARRLLATTSKVVLFHSIEGAHLLLDGPQDAAFWASKGVALITLVHLVDDEHGGSAITPGLAGALVNPTAVWRRWFRPARRGLTDRGRAAIVELARAGIMVDLTHMSPAAIDDALEVCREHRIPPVVTHGWFAPVRSSERSFSPAQVLEIYRLGGAFALPLNGAVCDPRRPSIPVPPDLPRGTLHSFRFHHETLQRFLLEHAAEALGEPTAPLDDARRTRLAVGWASDWNGFTSHSRPDPTRPAALRTLEIDRVGLAHPGLLPQHWQRLSEAGMDLDPLHRSVEQLLGVWTRARAPR